MSITASQTETSVNLKFMAFVFGDQNELHVWDINTKARCLSRHKPTDLVATLDPETQFSTIKFSSTQEHVLAIGFSNGNFAIYDCAKAKLIREAAVCTTPITALAFTTIHNVLVASQTKLQLVQISPALKVVEQVETYMRSSKKAMKKAAKGQEGGLAAIRMSVANNNKDKPHVVQVDKKGGLRVSGVDSSTQAAAIWSQPNVHPNGVKGTSFAEGAKHVATCSIDEAALWSVKHDQPLVILDEPSADRSLQQIDFAKIKNASFLVCTGTEEIALYQLPSTLADSSQAKAIIKPCDCRVSLGLSASENIQGQILACKLGIDQGSKKQDSVSMTVVYGNLYKIIKKKIAIGTLSKLKKRVSIAEESQSTSAAGANPEEEETKGGNYHVAGLDQENAPMTAQNLRLLPSDASLENIESRMTSVSGTTKKGAAQPGASLTNVLRQALQSDDTDQLNWVITQKDPAVVEATLVQIQEKEAIAGFFRLVLAKFQQEKSVQDQLAVLLWLRTLLRVHWALVVQVASQTDLANLSQIQGFIQRKTANMDKLLLLKGKLEMAKRTIQLQKGSLKKSAVLAQDRQTKALVYKDSPEGGDDSSQSGEEDEDDQSMDGADDSEEEIKEIPLKKLAQKNKRARLEDHLDADLGADSDEQSEEDDDSDRYEKEPVKKGGKVNRDADSEDEEDVGDSDDMDSDEAKRQMDKLADSDDDDDIDMNDEDESSSGNGDI